MIIAVDGPAGAGKGTICNIVASSLGITNYCSGEVYRLCAYLMKIKNTIDTPDDLVELIKSGQLKYYWNDETCLAEIWLEGENIREDLHQNSVSKITAEVSARYSDKIAKLVRLIGQQIEGDFICEGRNVASYIFTDCDYKFYVDASSSVRAQRRQQDLLKKGLDLDFETVLQEIEDRDYRDMTRSHSPLVRLPDAVLIDTSNQTIEESVAEMISYLEKTPA